MKHHDRSDGRMVEGNADRVVVMKQAHILTLYRQGQPLKTYQVALGRGGIGPKTQAGDNKVPEGVYRIVAHNPHSAFHRALKVGYPTPEQARLATARGINPGGDIMIHGIRNGLGWLGSLQRRVDWTKGCVAVTDSEIEEIARSVPDGTPIEIEP
jgi:murein L,D-transpeptidase YafK